MTELFGEVTHRMPLNLVEPVEKMINKDIRYRPTPQLFTLVSMYINKLSFRVWFTFLHYGISISDFLVNFIDNMSNIGSS